MADKESIKQVTEVKAFARGIHVSPRKARLVVNVIKKLPVEKALLQLDFLTKKAARPIKKLVDSAVASASHNFNIGSERLFIKSMSVDGGRVFFRYKPRAQGRALPVRKRTSHINLVLGVAAKPFEKVEIKKPVSMRQAPEAKEAKKEEPKPLVPKDEAPKKKSRFAFWKNFKGKKYTSFDRRSGQ